MKTPSGALPTFAERRTHVAALSVEDVLGPRRTPHVAILIPSAGHRALANLARVAIAAFTQDVSHEVWLMDHPRGAPWPENGSEANGLALDHLIQASSVFSIGPPYRPPLPKRLTHVFAMHDDALPILAGWLSYLLAQPGPVVGVKASERNGYAHASGVLMEIDFALTHSMLPDLPTRDAGEWPGWCAASYCHRLGEHEWRHAPQWWAPFNCDVSLDGDGQAFYVHLGGGTIQAGNETPGQRDTRVAAWIAAARKGLGL